MELGIVWLVRVAWIAAILPMLIASIPNSKLTSFHQLVLGFARRGKILQPSLSSQVFIKACHFIQLPSLLIRLKLMFQLQNHTIATLVWDLSFLVSQVFCFSFLFWNNAEVDTSSETLCSLLCSRCGVDDSSARCHVDVCFQNDSFPSLVRSVASSVSTCPDGDPSSETPYRVILCLQV